MASIHRGVDFVEKMRQVLGIERPINGITLRCHREDVITASVEFCVTKGEMEAAMDLMGTYEVSLKEKPITPSPWPNVFNADGSLNRVETVSGNVGVATLVAEQVQAFHDTFQAAAVAVKGARSLGDFLKEVVANNPSMIMHEPIDPEGGYLLPRATGEQLMADMEAGAVQWTMLGDGRTEVRYKGGRVEVRGNTVSNAAMKAVQELGETADLTPEQRKAVEDMEKGAFW